MASSCEECLKSALAAGDFSEAQRLLPAYSEEIVTLLAQPSGLQDRERAVESFRNLLSLARVVRAHIAVQLSQLQRQASYRYHVPSSDRHSWHFEG